MNLLVTKQDMTDNQCWSQFLLVCCLSILLVCRGAVAIKIGAIINTVSKDGRQLQTGLEVAAQLFNSSTYKFFLNIRSSGEDVLHAASIASELINEWGAAAIISSGTSQQVAIVADVGRRTKTPVISLTATPLVPRPYFVQMSYSSLMIVRCLVDLIRSYDWRSAILLYEEDDDCGSIYGGIITSLSNALRGVGAVIEKIVSFPRLDSSLTARDIVGKEMERVVVSQRCRVFVILRSSPLLTFHLFEEAQRLGLTEAGNAWIVADSGVNSILEMGEKLSFSYISSNVQGVIGVKPYFDETSVNFQRFHSRFRKRYPTKHQELKISAMYGHDAIHAITIGMAESKKRRTTLLEGILESKFEGLSGSIQFGNDGIRLENNSLAFQVINFVGKSYREMGFWSEGFGLCKQKDVSVNSLLPVLWPGEQIKVPGGWGKLRVGVPGNNVFDGSFVKVEYDHNGRPSFVSGFCIDVFKASLKKLKYYLDFEFLPFNGSYDDLIQQVALKRFDVAVGDITILADRMPFVDFTLPFTESSIGMLVRTKTGGNAWMVLKPFSKGLLGLIVASFIYTTLIVWYLETRSINLNSTGAKKVRFGTTLWLMFSTIFFNLSQNIRKIMKIEDYHNAFQSGKISAAFMELPYMRLFLSLYKDYTIYGESQKFGGFGIVRLGTWYENGNVDRSLKVL
ncbi:Periplasmic binding protein-like II protein [Dioscorea alata]|uniref:Periplasmic binding protein-like II protein n=1 Tax=Dioscorea alata TaxID=55571 RepID=A0ACB7WMH4_DIOAL|nr:Periplasmic binding protein-like II protein [Dioscorea alata]